MTLPLLTVQDDATQFNFDQIANAIPDTGGQGFGVRAGQFTATAGGDTTQAHGLGTTPVAVVATPLVGGGAPGAAINYVIKSKDATNFVLNLAGITNYNFLWVAIG